MEEQHITVVHEVPPEPRKWSWTEFILGWINKKFLVFIVCTVFVQSAVFDGQSDDIKKMLILIWGVIALVWMLSCALEKIISNGKLNVEAKLGASVSK